MLVTRGAAKETGCATGRRAVSEDGVLCGAEIREKELESLSKRTVFGVTEEVR